MWAAAACALMTLCAAARALGAASATTTALLGLSGDSPLVDAVLRACTRIE